MMKNYGLLTVLMAASMFVASCEEYPQMVTYPAPDPKSDIGRKIVEKTDRICTIFKDSTYTLHAGVEVTEMAYLSEEGRPMKTFWYRIDLTEPAVSLECVTPFASQTIPSGPEALSDMLSHYDREGHEVIGGTSSDFGGGAGPQGVFWADGKCLKDEFTPLENRPRSFFYITRDKKTGMGYQDEYDSFISEHGGEVSELFCGSPRLITDGNIDIEVPNDLDDESHPRTAIGILPDMTTVYILVVDGRRYEYSNGMHLDVLAEMFHALGCVEAMNLDGGGSSTFIVGREGEYGDPARFDVRNWPNDNGGEERPLYNGLAIISSAR